MIIEQNVTLLTLYTKNFTFDLYQRALMDHSSSIDARPPTSASAESAFKRCTEKKCPNVYAGPGVRCPLHQDLNTIKQERDPQLRAWKRAACRAYYGIPYQRVPNRRARFHPYAAAVSQPITLHVQLPPLVWPAQSLT